MLVAYDESLTRHLSGVAHVERPDRVRAVAAELARRGLLGECIDTRQATHAELERAHTSAYIDLVQRECERVVAGGVDTLTTGDAAIDASS
jgi:acetoin utilization deacetylase AcuC-like enzyme